MLFPKRKGSPACPGATCRSAAIPRLRLPFSLPPAKHGLADRQPPRFPVVVQLLREIVAPPSPNRNLIRRFPRVRALARASRGAIAKLFCIPRSLQGTFSPGRGFVPWLGAPARNPGRPGGAYRGIAWTFQHRRGTGSKEGLDRPDSWPQPFVDSSPLPQAGPLGVAQFPERHIHE